MAFAQCRGRLVTSAQVRDDSEQLLKLGRLDEPRPCPECLPDGRDLIGTREHDDGNISEPGLGVLRGAEFPSPTVKHHQVEEDDAGRQPRAEEFERFFATGCGRDVAAAERQRR